ncbi:MAG: 50S ribosome-binding GTPase [Candidatus Omnitrophica bacterium]|nr:50S ribosome-binding GTPase [Candidatus Omnitrophota bacterium]
MPPSDSSLPKIAIVGRPNVGKSTLFNRLIGRRRSIVQRESGTTRDRLYGKISWNSRDISVIDTGGLRFEREKCLDKLIDKEVMKAIKEADLIFFIVDGKDGLTAQDEELADYLRKNKAKDNILLLVNKMDNPHDNIPPEFYKLGFTVFGGLSALHGINTGELLDSAVEKFPASKTEEKPALFRLAIMGKQNVGKSTYLNALLREERAIVSEIPGTTRDYIEELLE